MFPRPNRKISIRGATLSLVLNLVMATSLMAAEAGADPAPVTSGSAVANLRVFGTPLWPHGAPGAKGAAEADKPVLVQLSPAAEKTTGCTVVIVPRSDDTDVVAGEGAQLQRWFFERGINACVAGYRRAPYEKADALADVIRALQTVRGNVGNASPRIGLLGFGEGAALAADTAYNRQVEAKPDASDSVERVSSRPDFVALIWGSAPVEASATSSLPPTFLVGSARVADGQSGMVELWERLRDRRRRGGTAAGAVDAHFFASAPAVSQAGIDQLSSGAWPEIFFTWVRHMGFLTDQPRVPLRGSVHVDGRTLPHGYFILTPIDFVGAGPIAVQILNSTSGVPLGQFSVPAHLGPVPGRYRVDVRQNMTRWLSNSFSNELVNARGGVNPTQAWFGHHRPLAPSVPDQQSFTKVRPGDKDDYIIEIKPDAGANLALKIEVFSSATLPPAVAITPVDAALAGLLTPPQNPGQTAYVEQLKAHPPAPVPGLPEPILLWPEGAPGAVPDANGTFTDEDKPALYAFPAPTTGHTGAAFLVIPGGAFTNRGMDNEGVQIAKFLNRNGLAGFVLRYRIGPNYPSRNISTMDGQRALRWIRAHAAEYGVDPNRIGIIGFSAGAELEGDAFYNAPLAGNPAAADPIDRLSAQANFSALIYGGRNVQNPAVAPPTFLFNTLEDNGHLTVQTSVLNSLRNAGTPVEAHFYQYGPHGTSMSLGDPQLGQWPGLMVKWLKTGGWLDARPNSVAP